MLRWLRPLHRKRPRPPQLATPRLTASTPAKPEAAPQKNWQRRWTTPRPAAAKDRVRWPPPMDSLRPKHNLSRARMPEPPPVAQDRADGPGEPAARISAPANLRNSPPRHNRTTQLSPAALTRSAEKLLSQGLRLRHHLSSRKILQRLRSPTVDGSDHLQPQSLSSCNRGLLPEPA